jgi:hypothetical protein
VKIRRGSLQLVFAIIAALAVLHGCASHKPKPTPEEQSQADLEYYQAQIRKVVKEREPAEQLAGLATQFQKLVLDRADIAKSYQAKIAKLNSTYSATRADYESLAADNERDRNLFLEQVIALRAQMASLTTDEEWEQLKGARMRGLESILNGRP